jgi:hypothetical protein
MILPDFSSRWPELARRLGLPKRSSRFIGTGFQPIGGLVVPVRDLIREEFDSVRLREGAPFLRPDKVEVGDVLLTRGRFLTSSTIAVLGGGYYSHAAVFIAGRPSKTNPSQSLVPLLIESEDLGTGYTHLDGLWVQIDAGEREHVVSIPGRPIAAVLLRHLGLSKVEPDILLKASKKIAEQLWLEYPPWVRLVGAIGAPPTVAKALRSVLARTERGIDPISVGSFCSQLVGQFYEQVPVDLLKVKAAPCDISPNLLIGENTNLTPVEGAIIEGSAITARSTGERIWSPHMPVLDVSRETWLPRLKAWRLLERKMREVLPPLIKSMIEKDKQRFDDQNRDVVERYLQEVPRLARIIRQLRIMKVTSEQTFQGQRNRLLNAMAIDHILERATERIDAHPLARRARGVLVGKLHLQLHELWYELMTIEAKASNERHDSQATEINKTFENQLPLVHEKITAAAADMEYWKEDADVVPHVENLLKEIDVEFAALKIKMLERDKAASQQQPDKVP